MSNYKYFQQFFSPDGTPLHDQQRKWMIVHYWNDACWRRSVPVCADGLTYLDVGCSVGYYCLRFEHQGGNAVGLDFDLAGPVNRYGAKFPGVGDEHIDEPLQEIRRMYDARYKVFIGGFDERGGIIPALDKFDIVSSLNVIEYMTSPRSCIKSLFSQARERVIVATDVCLDGRSYEPVNMAPLKWISGIEDLKDWMEWPYVYWLFDVRDEESPSKHQAFFVATRPGSSLPEVDVSPGRLRCDLPDMELVYRESRGIAAAQSDPPQFYDGYEFQAHRS